MLSSKPMLVVIVFLLTATLGQSFSLAADQKPDGSALETPQAVVARWLELHRTRKHKEAAALTTGHHYHRAGLLLSPKRDTGVRVARSLGNERVAAVVTNALDGARDGEQVLLFWLVQRAGIWRIHKSDSFEGRVVDERLRGFLEAGDVRWHLRRDELLGSWEAGAGVPPGGDFVACRSQLQLGEDKQYRLVAWGPAGPEPEDEGMQGKWRVVNGQILFSDQDRLHVGRVAWLADKLLVLESLDEKGNVQGHARYERVDAEQSRSDAVSGGLDRQQRAP